MERWLDVTEYPFERHYFNLPMGRLHYIDEGKGDQTLVMVHGNPSWSFSFRHLIKGLCSKYRCVAMDHIGFGLSDKPPDWSYLPKDHAWNLTSLLESLNLENITMVVQDWGGPIGLSYALRYPEKIKALIILNTWMWPVNGDPHYEKFSGMMGSAAGRFLIKRFNLFARIVMKQAYGDKSKLTRQIHAHYLNALKTPDDRKGCWVFPKQIIASTNWLEDLWRQRSLIADKPALILWGKKDIAFRDKELSVWKECFNNATVREFEHVGHYVQEEMGSKLCPMVDDFLNSV